MPRWTAPEASLTATEDVVFAELPDGTGGRLTHAIPPRTFMAGMWEDTLVTWLGPVIVAEARAYLTEREQTLAQRTRAKVKGRLGERPIVPRDGGTSRVGWSIRGRVVEIRGQAWRKTMTVDIVAAAGLPPDHPLTAELEASLCAAATTLAAFPCACGTGARSAAEHGTMRILAEVKDATRAGTVGRCEVCGRAWTFDDRAPCVRASFDPDW